MTAQVQGAGRFGVHAGGAAGVVFGLRAVLVAVGLVLAMRLGGSVVGFVVGFFGAYLALQCIELSYVVAAAPRGPDGDER